MRVQLREFLSLKHFNNTNVVVCESILGKGVTVDIDGFTIDQAKMVALNVFLCGRELMDIVLDKYNTDGFKCDPYVEFVLSGKTNLKADDTCIEKQIEVPIYIEMEGNSVDICFSDCSHISFNSSIKDRLTNLLIGNFLYILCFYSKLYSVEDAVEFLEENIARIEIE